MYQVWQTNQARRELAQRHKRDRLETQSLFGDSTFAL